MESRNEIYDPDGDASRFLDFEIPRNLDQVLCFEYKLPEEIMHQDIEVPRPEEFESQPTSLPAISMNFESQPTSLPPVSIDQIDCTNCITVKEEVVYSSSTRHVTLIVHGALGTFDHANFDVLYFGKDGRVSTTEHFRANISTQTYEQVKNSVISCIIFHDALCGGTKNFDNIYPGDANRNNFDSFVGSSCVPIDNYPSENMLVESDNEAVRPLQRSALALQKQRTANMTMSEVEPYLHLTLVEAAKRLNLSQTALKRVCRRHGHACWPGRQIRANNRKNAALEMNKAKIDRTHG